MAKRPDWDDGRTVADMSGVDGFSLPRRKKEKPLNVPEEESGDERPWEDTSMSREDRRAYVFGALGATVMIACVYLAAFAALIALMLRWLS